MQPQNRKIHDSYLSFMYLSIYLYIYIYIYIHKIDDRSYVYIAVPSNMSELGSIKLGNTGPMKLPGKQVYTWFLFTSYSTVPIEDLLGLQYCTTLKDSRNCPLDIRLHDHIPKYMYYIYIYIPLVHYLT